MWNMETISSIVFPSLLSSSRLLFVRIFVVCIYRLLFFFLYPILHFRPLKNTRSICFRLIWCLIELCVVCRMVTLRLLSFASKQFPCLFKCFAPGSQVGRLVAFTRLQVVGSKVCWHNFRWLSEEMPKRDHVIRKFPQKSDGRYV